MLSSAIFWFSIEDIVSVLFLYRSPFGNITFEPYFHNNNKHHQETHSLFTLVIYVTIFIFYYSGNELASSPIKKRQTMQSKKKLKALVYSIHFKKRGYNTWSVPRSGLSEGRRTAFAGRTTCISLYKRVGVSEKERERETDIYTRGRRASTHFISDSRKFNERYCHQSLYRAFSNR